MNRRSRNGYRARLDPDDYRSSPSMFWSGMAGNASPAAGAINSKSIILF